MNIDKQIQQKIIKYNNLFFIEGIKKINDEVFDFCSQSIDRDQLEIFDGIKGNANQKSYHITPINSVKKINILSNPNIFKNNEEFKIQPKLDGMFINCIYIDGYLHSMITRGNKIYGDNIVNKGFHTLVPKQIFIGGKVEIRGELVAKKSFLGNFKHSRNIVISAASRIYTELSEIGKMKFFAFEILCHDKSNLTGNDNEEDLLLSMGFNVIKSHQDICQNFNEVKNVLSFFKNIKDSIDYDIDGIVIKSVNNNNKQYHAIKFNELIAKTSIVKIVSSTGRSGIVIPIAYVNKVNLANSEIQKVSLYSFNHAKNLKITHNNIVTITKTGDAVPVITKVENHNIFDNETAYIDIPLTCNCGETLKDIGKISICTNKNCIFKKAEFINYVSSRNVLNISGISKKNAMSIANLMKNQCNLLEILLLPNILSSDEAKKIIGNKNCEKITYSISKIKSLSLQKFLLCLNIPGIGEKFVKNITYTGIINNLDQLKMIIFAEKYVKDKKQIQSLNEYFADDKNNDVIKNIMNIIVITTN